MTPDALQRPIDGVRRRLRAQRAIEASVWLLAVALSGVLAMLLARRLGLVRSDDGVRLALLALAVLPLAGAGAGALRRLPPLLAPRLLDHTHRTNDLFASAFSFRNLATAERTPFMDACVASAAEAAARVDPARAAPWVAPRALRYSAGLLLATAAVVLAPRSAPPPAPPPPKLAAKPRLLQQEDVVLASAEIAPLLPALAEDPALAPLREELNALLEALKDERLERAEALLALRELQDRLAVDELAQDQSALDEAMRELGKQLGGGGPQQKLADALAQAEPEAAREQAEQLASELGAGKASAKDEQRLARALEKAGQRSREAEQARQRVKDERDRLLKKKQEASQRSPEQERLLKKKERELDQLERELEQAEQAERSLDELRRELEQSGKSLGERKRQQAQERMQRGAEALKKLAQRKLSAAQRKALAEKLEQLRELISKQRSGAAQGKPGGDGQPQAGDGQQRLDVARFGKLARGQNGQPGESPGSGEGSTQGGEPKLLVPGEGDGEGDAVLAVPGQEGTQSGTTLQDAPNARGGSKAGLGGSPELQDQASARSGQHVDTRVEGQLGEGPTRSEVIHEAGQRGFASLPYQKVHAEYERHAERMLERDHVPGGYKFYVRRYFQLIRPREEAP